MKNFATRTQALKESIFTTMTNKARAANAINLAQGFPDFDGPSWLVEYAQDILKDEASLANQYGPAAGAMVLRQAICKQQAEDWGCAFDPDSEITVTVGATEAIYATLQALVDPNDEVVVFEPLYDSYAATIDMIGAVSKAVTLRLPDFSFDEEELRQAFSKKTKVVMINSPHNPTGKIFKREELDLITKLAIEYDCWIITDEVYEHLTFESSHQDFTSWRNQSHVRERCIAISSAGKTFGMTGWKIGWTMAPANVTQKIRMVHQYIPFCATHPLQHAVAHGLLHRVAYLAQFRQDYTRKRDLLFNGLKELGYNVIKPEGTYFIQVQIDRDGFDYCNDLITKQGVAAIPTAPFYLKSKQGEHLIRMCFAKKDETIRAALIRLQN